MPSTIKVLAWNVESFGLEKATLQAGTTRVPSKLIEYVARVIHGFDADVIGLMEIKGGIGDTLGSQITAQLDNLDGGARWQWAASPRQDGGTQEQYLMLLRPDQQRLAINTSALPGAMWLMGVADSKLFSTTALQDLANAGYLGKGSFRTTHGMKTTQDYRVVPNQWNALNNSMQPAVSLTGSYTQQELEELAQKLLKIDILRFISYGDRAPLVVNLNVGAQPVPLTIVVFHAPGPQDPDRVPALNNISLCSPLGSSTTLLIMGDFNISAERANMTGPRYGRYQSDSQHFVFGRLAKTLPQQVFAPIKGQPLNAGADLLGTNKTSLVTGFFDDNVPVGDVLANAYDKFLFRQGGLTSSNAQVIDLLTDAATAQNSDAAAMARARLLVEFFRGLRMTNTDFLSERAASLGQLAFKLATATQRAQVRFDTLDGMVTALAPSQRPKALLKRWADAQKKLQAFTLTTALVTSQLSVLASLRSLVASKATLKPTGIGSAHALYRYSVSDHLPIIVSLTG